MERQWTFGQRVAAGLAAMAALSVLVAVMAVMALRDVVASKDDVIGKRLLVRVDAERLQEARARKSAALRAYAMEGVERYRTDLRTAQADFEQIMGALEQAVASSEGQQILRSVRTSNSELDRTMNVIAERRQAGVELAELARAFETEVAPRRDRVVADIGALVTHEDRMLEIARQASTAVADRAVMLLVGMTAGLAVLALLLTLFLTRTVSAQVGTAVSQVQSSSAELQAAARQQASAAKEQASSMTEVSTTMSELLATSRQIADSSRRVSQIADDTARSAREGDATVDRAHASISSIRRQVDLIVVHMGELGKTSQKVGAVLDIVSELAEQTNILAINATIEAAGAGESGKRFGVVADEIRKLADRVTASTKEIRALVDDVRTSVNTTVMVTETGSKAVDSGTKQFTEVATWFRQIASMVSTTTDAAREIELSTKQQSSAVEQVNGAINSVAQSTREAEAGMSQTLQTAVQLADLSRQLMRMVKAEAS